MSFGWLNGLAFSFCPDRTSRRRKSMERTLKVAYQGNMSDEQAKEENS
jgi:hypothetical protein